MISIGEMRDKMRALYESVVDAQNSIKKATAVGGDIIAIRGDDSVKVEIVMDYLSLAQGDLSSVEFFAYHLSTILHSLVDDNIKAPHIEGFEKEQQYG